MRSASLLAVAVLTVVLALSSAHNVFATTKLYYDSGSSGGTGGSFLYAGVRFSLPSGVNSAHLLDIQYWWSSSDTNALTIYITGSDHKTLLTAPIPVATSTWLWNTVDVSGSGVVVTGDFYVVVQRTTGTIGSTLEFDNVANVGRSYLGASLTSLTVYKYGQNWMIRVDIDPIAQAPVGGFVLPANTLALIAPWLAVIGLVGCIGTVAVISRKRES